MKKEVQLDPKWEEGLNDHPIFNNFRKTRGLKIFPPIMQSFQNFMQEIPPMLWIMKVFSISTVIRG